MWQQITARWLSCGIDVPGGASASEIDAFEQRHGVCLPTEMREFYTQVNGMPHGMWDDEFISFYPLSEIHPAPVLLVTEHKGSPDYTGIEHSLPNAMSFFVFADYSIRCHVYAVQLSADPFAACPVVWIAGGDTWQLQAKSFGEFLRLYAEEPGQVLFPDERNAEPGAAPDPRLKAGGGR